MNINSNMCLCYKQNCLTSLNTKDFFKVPINMLIYSYSSRIGASSYIIFFIVVPRILDIVNIVSKPMFDQIWL